MRSVLLYLSLVGLPIVGMVGALHLGQEMRAPASVAGAWRVELSGAAGDPHRRDDAPPPEPPALYITQSGPHIVISACGGKRVAAVGELREMTLTAVGDGLQVRANLRYERDQARLQGFISLKACGKPAEAEFHATRAPEQEAEEH